MPCLAAAVRDRTKKVFSQSFERPKVFLLSIIVPPNEEKCCRRQWKILKAGKKIRHELESRAEISHKNKKPLKLKHFNGLKLVGRDGFEPSKSLTADLQSAPFGHSGTYPYKILELVDGLEPPTC